MLCSACLVVLATVFGYMFLKWKNGYWKRLGVPCEDPTILIGNAPNTFTQKENPYMDVSRVYNKFCGKFNFVGFYNFMSPVLVVLDPALIRRIFLTEFHKFNDNGLGDVINKYIDPILGRNPFFLNGHEWKERRAEVTPAFTVSRLKALYPVIESVCKDLRSHIDKEIPLTGDQGVDARELSAKYTTDVVSNCVFALDAGSLKDKEAVIRKMGKEMLKPSFRVFFLFVVSGIVPSLNRFLKIKLIPTPIEKFFVQLMKDAVEHREKTGQDKGDILQFLVDLKNKKNLDDVNLVANAITFFLDGFETSSVTMAFVLYELAKSEPIQEKLRQEILEAEQEGPLTMESIADLPYLDQVIFESLRLHPAALAASKRSLEPFEFPLTEDGKVSMTFPAGTTLIIPSYDIHRDASIFPDPLEFKPERFDDGGLKAHKDQGTMLMFGMGPRVCLGQRFALTQIKAAIVDILKNFKMSVNAKTKEPIMPDPKEFLNVPLGGIWIDFKRL